MAFEIYQLVIIITLSLVLIAFSALVRFSEKIILRWYSAKRVPEESELCKTLDSISKKSGIACPKLYTTKLSMPNAFSVGKSPENASIVLTEEAIEILDKIELESVFAHEIFKIKNKNIKIATISAVFCGLLTGIATIAFWGSMFLGFGQKNDPAPRLIKFFSLSLFAPHAAFLINLTNRKQIEFAADEYSTMLCQSSKNLISALIKMEGEKISLNPSHAHLFIIRPLDGEMFNLLFNVQPPIEERLKNLKRLTT